MVKITQDVDDMSTWIAIRVKIMFLNFGDLLYNNWPNYGPSMGQVETGPNDARVRRQADVGRGEKVEQTQ